MNLPIEILIALLVWGTFVGIDLVSLPQMMIARPLVAGAIAGTILGDIPTGLKLGVIFELLQYGIRNTDRRLSPRWRRRMRRPAFWDWDSARSWASSPD